MKIQIERIKSLAKEKGISIAYICEKIGMGRGYFNDIKKSNGGDIPLERLKIIVEILNTSIEYLSGDSDKKEKNSDRSAEFVELFSQLSEDQQNLIVLQIKGILSHLSDENNKMHNITISSNKTPVVKVAANSGKNYSSGNEEETEPIGI